MKNIRNLLWILPLALFASSPLWKPSVENFLKPRGGYDPQLADLSNRQQQNFVMDSISITLTSAGKEEWVVNAQQAFTGKTDQELGMIQVDALYKGKDEPITMSSNEGTYYIKERHLILIDNVIISKPKSREELHTELLHYYDATKMVVSPVEVHIMGPRFSLRAGRMDYDLSTDGYDFSKRVSVKL